MELADFLLSLGRLGSGAVAAFFAILLWSRTRDMPWVLVIVGTIVLYAEIVYSTLARFGVVGRDAWTVSGVPLFQLLLANLPPAFYVAAFIVMIRRKGTL